MKLGLVHINMGSMSEPEHLVAAARSAEAGRLRLGVGG